MASALALTFHGVTADLLPSGLREVPSILRYTLSPQTLTWILNRIRPESCSTGAGMASVPGGESVVLTFDDGFRSDYEVVFKALIARRLKATFFVTTGNVGREGYVTWDQLQEMASAGMEIGSHGLTHRNLLSLGSDEARGEVRCSKEALEGRLGTSVVSFAPVGGHYERWMVEEAWSSGYRVFASMVPGRTTLRPGTMFMRRNFVQAHHGAGHLGRLLRGDRLTLLGGRVRYELLRASRRIIGLKRYQRVRSFVLRKPVS